MSVTIHQDGPDLANQGTIVACQVPIQPKIYNSGVQMRSDRAGGVNPDDRSLVCLPHYAMFTDLDRPSYEASQAMPNAYFNNSKFGAYMPLKLTKTCQQWHSDSDNIAVLPYNSTSDFDEVGTWYDRGLGIVGPVGGDSWPFPGLVPASITLPPSLPEDDPRFATVAQSIGEIQGYVTSALCNDVWGQISARNLSVQTSLSIFVRVGFEVQVLPSSVLSPHQKLSPPCDKEALAAYFHIARELKDAYPEDYNSVGKILAVIGKVAKEIAPSLSIIPKIGPMLSPIVQYVGAGAEMFGNSLDKGAFSDKQAQQTKSAADIEKAQTQHKVSQALARAPRARKQQPKQQPRKRGASVGFLGRK